MVSIVFELDFFGPLCAISTGVEWPSLWGTMRYLARIWPKTKKKFTPIFFINQGCCQSLPCESTCFVAHRTSQKMRGIRNWKNCWKSIIRPLQSVAIPGPQKGLRAAFPGPAKENPLNTSLLIPPRCQKSTFQNFRFRTRPLMPRLWYNLFFPHWFCLWFFMNL